jgi:hypothetical protein
MNVESLTATIQNVPTGPEIKLSGTNATPTPAPITPAAGSANDTVTIDGAGAVKTSYKAIQDAKNQGNAAAETVQRRGAALDAVQKNLEVMKQNLSEIVKNFPPFLAGSPERVKLLKSFNGLKHEIDQLTIPPPPSDAVIPQKINSSNLGLQDMPIMPPGDTDEGIYQALNSLDSAAKVVKQQQDYLPREVSAIGAGFEKSGVAGTGGSLSISTGMSGESALAVSVQVKSTLAQSDMPGLSGSGIQLLK